MKKSILSEVTEHLEKGMRLARCFKYTPISPETCNSGWLYDNDEYLRETAVIKKQIGEEEYNLIAEKWFAEHRDECTEIVYILLKCSITELACFGA